MAAGRDGKTPEAFPYHCLRSPAVLDGDTMFEVGSVTKAFTSLLIADMAARNEVALYDRGSDRRDNVHRLSI
jgi:CubicO group peptidase (beta-lactamase class C family)